MSTKRLRGPARTGGEKLTEDQLCYLVSGGCLDGGPDERWEVEGHLRPFPSVAAMKAAYKKHKSAVEAEVLKEREWSHELRSWAWWQFESPERLRQLSGPKPIVDLDAHFAAGADNYFSGKNGPWKSHDDFKAAVFETEYQFLKRLGLLLPGDIEEGK